jgi:peptide/nickel transport system substrate-binding protein
MKRSLKIVLLGAALALIAALVVVPTFAQETGQGGIIIEGTFSGDPQGFNPLLFNDTASSRIYSSLFPSFIAANPAEAILVPSDGTDPLAKGLVSGWEISEDGLTYTFTLRQDYTWSDGTPITSADVLYTWEVVKAAADGLNGSTLGFLTDEIGNVTATDDYTVVVEFLGASCTNLLRAASLTPVPSHVLTPDVTAIDDDPFNLNPTVTSGPFVFGELRPSEQVSLLANPDYADAELGYVSPTGFIYKQVPDQTVVIEQFLAGETNVIDNPAVNRRADLRAAADAGEKQIYTFSTGAAWDYMAFNLADPNNPQNGEDADGNPIPQGNHPLFGDVRVRQGIARAIDKQALIDAAVFGEGEAVLSFLVSSSWAHNPDMQDIPFDTAAAEALLDEAGFIDDDNDPATPRIAQGALYAPDGTPLRFTLFSNQGNTRREAVGTLIQDQLAQIGVQVDFQTIDFNTQLDIMSSQTFDAFILGWRAGFPDEPATTVAQIWSPSGDVVGAGSNTTSYYNAEFNELALQARNMEGCAPADRAAIYHQMEEIWQNDLPYVPLFTINGFYGADASISPWTPYGGGNNLYWNVDTWTVDQSTP